MKGSIGKAKYLLLLFPAIQGAGEAEEVVPCLQRPLIPANPRAARAKMAIKAVENGMQPIKLEKMGCSQSGLHDCDSRKSATFI